MEFGKTLVSAPLESVFLPAISHTGFTPASGSEPAFCFYLGAPVWGCPEWVGCFYPAKSRSQDYLFHYAQQFNCIELNSTFYALPQADTIARWVGSVHDSFRFSPKIPKDVSHIKNLTVARNLLADACERLLEFVPTLGRSFLQLPPHFSSADLSYLKNLLQVVPRGFQLAVEFRHPSWFQNQTLLPAAAELLTEKSIAPVITDTIGRRDVVHMSLTSPALMVRFLGTENDETDLYRLEQWLDRLVEWKNLGVREMYFFIHQPENATMPRLAEKWTPLVNKKLGTNLRAIKFHDAAEMNNPHSTKNSEQLSLF